MPEYLPLVDRSGKVIGKALRRDCHGNPTLIHPVVHLHVFDTRGRLLFQQRASGKDLYPDYWDTAVGGHIDFGEELRDAVRREAREELGLDAETAVFLFSYLMSNPYETEFVSTFALTFDGPFCVDPEEVAGVRFFTPAEVREKLGQGFFTPNAEEEIGRLGAVGRFSLP